VFVEIAVDQGEYAGRIFSHRNLSNQQRDSSMEAIDYGTRIGRCMWAQSRAFEWNQCPRRKVTYKTGRRGAWAGIS